VTKEECCFEDADQWGIDPGYEIFKIFVNALKIQLAESRKSRACERRVTSAFTVRERLRGPKLKAKTSEPGQS
jgi:hypothetical protein